MFRIHGISRRNLGCALAVSAVLAVATGTQASAADSKAKADASTQLTDQDTLVKYEPTAWRTN